MKLVFSTLLIVSLVLCSSLLQPTVADISTCGTRCVVRCTEAKEKKRCLQDCGICCNKCDCVPSGTYGNKSECPCYRDMLNSKGTSKCPYNNSYPTICLFLCLWSV